MFLKKNEYGKVRCLPCNAAPSLIANADGATMKLDNQKNGWKGVCVYHEANGEEFLCPVRALGQGYIHIRQHSGSPKTMLSPYWSDRALADVTAKHISRALILPQRNYNTQQTKGFQSCALTHTPCAMAVPTPYP